MTVEELSERIVNGDFLEHSDDPESTIEIQHYGVLGMKWGIRRDRQRKGESDQQYKDRMDRQSRERIAAADRKAREKEQKRTLRSQERIQKAQIRSNERKDAAQRKAQEKQQEAQRKAQAKQQAKDNKRTKSDINKNKKESSTKSMTDAELRDAISRMRAEREYAQLSKKPDSAATKAAKSVGKLAMKVGSGILVTQLTKVGTKKVSEILGTDDNSNKAKETAKKTKTTAEDVVDVVNKVSKTMSKNSEKLNLDVFNDVWKTKVYYDDKKKG